MPTPKVIINDRSQFSNQWASDRLTLIDYAIIEAGGPLAELVDEAATSHPELRVIGARSIMGKKFDQLVRTAHPTVAFRNTAEGANRSKSQYTNRTFSCHILDNRWDVDKADADGNEDGVEAMIAEEGLAHVEASFKTVGQQMYYGTNNDDKGFPGLHAIYDADGMTVDCAGTTDEEKSSVWLMRLTRNQCQFLLANGGKLSLSPVRIGDAFDENNKPYTAYIQELTGQIGFKVSDMRAVGRVKNCTKDSGKSITGNKVAELIAKFPTGQGPTHAFMNSTQREEYRQSLITPENPEPALPTIIQGLPIVPTDSIIDGHALETA